MPQKIDKKKWLPPKVNQKNGRHQRSVEKLTDPKKSTNRKWSVKKMPASKDRLKNGCYQRSAKKFSATKSHIQFDLFTRHISV